MILLAGTGCCPVPAVTRRQVRFCLTTGRIWGTGAGLKLEIKYPHVMEFLIRNAGYKGVARTVEDVTASVHVQKLWNITAVLLHLNTGFCR
jgi:hypothetical protein